MANLDDALDALGDIELTKKDRKRGKTAVISEAKFYENDCITDYKEKPYQLFLFVWSFWLKQAPSGRVRLEKKRNVIEFAGKTHREVVDKVYGFIEKECEGQLPDEAVENKKWFPSDFIEKKKALTLLTPK